VTTAAALAGCSASGSSDSNSVSIVGFSVLQQANEPVIADFQKTSDGKGVKFTTSYGASGDQSRAVANGVKADEVHLSLAPDVDSLVTAGLVDKNWADTPTHGIVTSSIVVFMVRKGNPLGIKTWDDLTKPGVKIVTPNPGSSGSAKWNLLAAWAHVTGNGGTDSQAKDFVSKLLSNVVSLPTSGSAATAAFTSGTGDVLLAYENDSIAARAGGADVDYVIPPDTLKIENPAAVTTDANAAAKAFLAFQTSKTGQTDYAKAGFRPVISGVSTTVEGAEDPSNPVPAVQKEFTVDKTFGGWTKANPEFFDDTNGIITKLLANIKVGQ
jgi:sulfate/thiosulfate transport system substrate-binding protein